VKVDSKLVINKILPHGYSPKFELPIIDKDRNNNRDENSGPPGRRFHQENDRPGGGPNSNFLRQNGTGYHAGNPNYLNKNHQPMRRLEDITCYKCNEKGHYANHCTT